MVDVRPITNQLINYNYDDQTVFLLLAESQNHRLQGSRPAEAFHFGTGEDHRSAPHRNLRQASAHDRDRRKARAFHGIASVRKAVSIKNTRPRARVFVDNIENS